MQSRSLTQSENKRVDGRSNPSQFLRPLQKGHGLPVRALYFNLVMPLGKTTLPTATRSTETTSIDGKSGAVCIAIGSRLRNVDVDSMNIGSTRTTATTLGCRISTTATRTTTTSRMSTALEPSADKNDTMSSHANFSFEALVQAYFDCRKHKRNTPSALAFEHNLERNLIALNEELASGEYKPGKSICFVVTRPKAREVWAADFRDRIVHHLLYNHIAPRFYASFIADSCACIPGRGTLYAANRLEHKIRSATQNWSKPCFYLKCDLANFFVSIDKTILETQLAKRVTEPFWMQLTKTILWHDPRSNFELRGHNNLKSKVPPHKQLMNQPQNKGLPIGNLSIQFFANVYLDALDQYAKHQLKAKHYIRYVDDFLIVHESADYLNDSLKKIDAWLPANLNANLNQKKTILQPVDRGVDFVGQVIRPWHNTTRKRTANTALDRCTRINQQDFFTTANSYFGLLGQTNSSHRKRAKIGKIALLRGHAINRELTKIYR